MKKQMRLAVMSFACTAIAGSACAGQQFVLPINNPTTVVQGSASRTDHRALIGVSWTFGNKVVPELVAGFRSVKTKDSGKSSGVGLDLTFPLSGGIAFDKLRLKGIDGRNDAQGELGFGYSFLGGGWLFTAGVQVPYLNGGADFLANGGWVPYIGINSQGRYKKPSLQSTTTDNLSCGAGLTLVPAAGTVAPSNTILNGQTCTSAPPA